MINLINEVKTFGLWTKLKESIENFEQRMIYSIYILEISLWQWGREWMNFLVRGGGNVEDGGGKT